MCLSVCLPVFLSLCVGLPVVVTTARLSFTLPPGGVHERACWASRDWSRLLFLAFGCPAWSCCPVSHCHALYMPATPALVVPAPSFTTRSTPTPWNPDHTAPGSLLLSPHFTDSTQGHLLQEALRVLCILTPPASWVFLLCLCIYYMFSSCLCLPSPLVEVSLGVGL